MMRTVNCQKISFCVNNSEKRRFGLFVAPAVTAHAAGLAVGIIINHLKIKPGFILQELYTVSADAETAVAQARNKLRIVMIYRIFTVIDHNKIIACALVFIKLNIHFGCLIFTVPGTKERYASIIFATAPAFI